MFEVIENLVKTLPREAVISFISYRDKEFSCYKLVQNMGVDFYFADPYCAWQRGSNENSNGLLRQYYPKQTGLAGINKEELITNLLQLNNRPRK